MGRQKLLIEYAGRRLIEYPIAAAQGWQPVVVCGRQVAEYLHGRDDVEIVLNEEPALGMSRSLALGSSVLPEHLQLIVLLGDKPKASEALIRDVLRYARESDFVYPQSEDVPGHPVVLSPRARRRLNDLPNGDSLRLLRDDPMLIVRAIATSDPGAFFDVDVMEML
jgi:CTP:molybdopterin cytidylyltransferase MocA